MEEVLRTENLMRSFRDGNQDTVVLKGISISIEKGEFISITGASGTGKSTLVYHLGLLDTPSGGSVFVGGQNAETLSVRERTAYRLNHFGFVFQDYALIPEMRAWENVALPVLMRSVPLSEARKRAVAVLDQLGLGNRINHTPAQLSGGESQRVSIARAIVHNPDVLFADEPTANLDDNRSRQIIDVFHELHRAGQTIVMVTHERHFAEEAERLVVLHDGLIEKDVPLK